LIINQVKNIYQDKQQRLKQYKNEVWYLVYNFFLAFNISFIPREENQKEDSFPSVVSTFRPPIGPNTMYQVEVRHRTSISDNIKHWQVFSDDLELQRFLQTIEEFYSISIEQEGEEDESENQQTSHLLNKVVGHNIVELKTNDIPMGLLPLERLFDSYDVSREATIKNQEEEVMDCNIETVENPKIVKLSKALATEQKDRYVSLMKKISDVFSWLYEDLKTFDIDIIQHKIPLKVGSKPFKHNIRQFNPMLMSIYEKELKQMFDARIIIPLRYSYWVAKFVHVRKKSGEIHLCVDFINLNKCSLKENYPLPKMDHILQRVVGAHRISLLYGYSGYNQITMCEEDKEKTTFTTPWGTFMYDKMPFRLINAGATFHRAMEIAFVGEKYKFMVIYLDDITIFSKSDDEHLQHLEQIFQKCRRYGISLNPKKSHFSMPKCNLLGHIISA
jgi:hypothetical protein